MSSSQFDAYNNPDASVSRSGANKNPGSHTGSNNKAGDSKVSQRRPFLGIQFECCGIYGRIYRNAAQTAYVGNCPKCAKRIKILIGPGGNSTRFFRAS
ncbi:hypothetical protein CA13_48610 [Planctomycetes bacterium CA13]|uniref:Uncharacterized protein n=1 Tax=Novipirellula herctigrandis TaxID=2527986 RepID=A0A5C5Z8J0_9BACT|nr:hypothetical protein CA13_48610 [Planctomycetes bacterium CA13]